MNGTVSYGLIALERSIYLTALIARSVMTAATTSALKQDTGREMTAMPTFKSMRFLRLNGGPGDSVIMEIAPTMKNLTYDGESYFRMSNSRAIRGGTGDKWENVERGGSYLWTRYWNKDQIELRKAERAAEQRKLDNKTYSDGSDA